MTQRGARALVELLRKRTVLWTTKIKGTEEHGLLLMIIRKIRPTPCSSVPLKTTTKIKGTEETNSIKQCSQQFFSPIAKDYFEWLQSMEGKGGEKKNGMMQKGIPYSDSNSREQVILHF